MISSLTNFESLPDEMILEICRFLSSTDVLYSLFNLNSRLNKTIFIYRRHVVLRRTSFIEFEYLCLNVLPKIGSTIRSLSINANWTDLLAKRFLYYFGSKINEIFPNLEHLILIAFSGNELNDYMDSITDLPYLKKLTIHDRYNVTEEYKKVLFDKILSANKSRLEKIFFNRHSESLTIDPTNSIIYSNIIHLSIHLEKIDDLRYLFKLIPNIQQLFIVINKQLEDEIIQFDDLIMKNLTQFHMESFRRSWIFNEIKFLIKQMPFLQSLSLDLFSQDVDLFYGNKFLSILPMNTLKQFNLAIDYTSDEEIHFIDQIKSSWESTPYSVCCLIQDKHNHMFLHTIPYGFSYLDISSSFVRYMNKNSNELNYYIKELLLFSVMTLSETFIAIRNCKKVKDLALEIDDSPSSEIDNKQETISLPRLNQLHWLSIDGCPPDVHLIKDILAAAPNLCMLIIDMKYFLRLIDKPDNQTCFSLLENRVKHLSLQISDENEIDNSNIKKLSDIFLRVRHLIIENKTTNQISIENILLLFLNHFKNHKLISIIIRSPTSDQLRDNHSQWLLDNTYLNEYINKFKSECDEIEIRIWL